MLKHLMLFLRSTRKRWLLLPPSFNTVMGDFSQCTKAKTKPKPDWKERSTTVFGCHDPKLPKSIKVMLKLMDDLHKLGGYKINKQNSVKLLYTGNEISGNEIKKTIHKQQKEPNIYK